MDAKTLNSTINAVCAMLPNHFLDGTVEEGKLILTNGEITLKADFRVGQRIALGGGYFARGSYKILTKLPSGNGFIYELEGLDNVSDELAIAYGQRMPQDFIDLCERIAKWEGKNEPTKVVSHSVGGYYSETVAVGADGLSAGWQDVFKKELRQYRTQMVTGVAL